MAKIQRGFAIWSPERLVTNAKRSARKARKNGNAYTPKLNERMQALRNGVFFDMLLRPLPGFGSQWLALDTVADTFGVHLRTAWRWVSYEWIKLERVPGRRGRKISRSSVRALHARFRRVFASELAEMRKARVRRNLL